jgi:hypothetical protein
MNDPKPLASLSPTLLARKGGARPAMRSQLQPIAPVSESSVDHHADDLGWNDHGHDAEVVSLKSAATLGVTIAEAAVPDIVRQQASIAARVAGPVAAPVVAPIRSSRPRRSALENGRRAAFTLRLDGERHLKLRLACTLRNRSAQQLIIDALDRMIDALPDIETLAAQVAKRR